MKNVIDSLLFYAALVQCMSKGKRRNCRSLPKRQCILGHRGARKIAPENTLSSLKLAMKHGADGVEFDVLLSHDGIPVVIHDDTLERTTDGHGKVADHTQQQLADVDATKLMPGFSKEGIPSLQMALDIMPDQALVNVELKGSGSFSKSYFVDRVLEDIKPHSKRLQILVSSFDSELIRLLRARGVDFLLALLLSPREVNYRTSLKDLPKLMPDALNLAVDMASPLALFLARRANFLLGLWTVNDIAIAHRWYDRGVDIIFTDFVPEVVTALRGKLD